MKNDFSMEQRCPICHKVIKSANQQKNGGQQFLPFCSERCKLIDLGVWLDADYKIISPQKSRESNQDFDLSESDNSQ
jgi:endogenous inhibitor of DNA gyrase (YacG/DUF329 family)